MPKKTKIVKKKKEEKKPNLKGGDVGQPLTTTNIFQSHKQIKSERFQINLRPPHIHSLLFWNSIIPFISFLFVSTFFLSSLKLKVVPALFTFKYIHKT